MCHALLKTLHQFQAIRELVYQTTGGCLGIAVTGQQHITMFSQKTIPATLQLRHFLRQGFMPNRHKHLFYKFIKILSESMYTISIYHLQQGVPQLSHALHRSHLPLLSVSKVVVTLNEGKKCIVTTYLHALDQWRCYTLLIQPHLCHSLHRTSSTALASLSPLPVTFLVLPHPF